MSQHFEMILLFLLQPITWAMFALGACIGSFLNVCIYRIPKKTFWQDARSKCPHCGAAIPIWFNIPIVSWLVLRGKAACCGGKISWQYPIIELSCAIVTAFIYWKFPFLSLAGAIEIDSAETLRFFHCLVFFSILLVCSVIDLHLQIIPDVISIPMILLTPLVIYLHPELNWTSGLVGALLGGGILYAIAILYYLLRREIGLGMGDVKLLAGIGGWLGYQALLPTLLVASITGAAVGILLILKTRSLNMQLRVPFGPFLSLGAMLYLLFGQQINEFLFYQGP